jgi:hypothetical protein
MTLRSVVVAGFLGAIDLLISGCGADDGIVIHSGDAVVLVGAEGDGNNMAGVGFSGKVSMVGPCLGIGDTTVFWPHGTKVVQENPLSIEVPGLGQVTVGDQLTGGADVYVDHVPKGIDAMPSDCPATEVVAFYPER